MKKQNKYGEIVTRKWIYAVELGNGLFGKPIKLKRRRKDRKRREVPKYQEEYSNCNLRRYFFRKKGIKKYVNKKIYVKNSPSKVNLSDFDFLDLPNYEIEKMGMFVTGYGGKTIEINRIDI